MYFNTSTDKLDMIFHNTSKDAPVKPIPTNTSIYVLSCPIYITKDAPATKAIFFSTSTDILGMPCPTKWDTPPSLRQQ